MDLATIDLCDLDLFASGFPEEVFAHLRREQPVWWQAATEHTPDGVGFWVLSRHADIAAVAADAESFSSERCPGAEGGGTLIQDLPYGFAAGVLLNMMDDPEHQRIRRLVTPALTPRALAAVEDDLRVRAERIIDAIAEEGSCDFLSDVAVELPIQAVAALMGVPDVDRHDLLRWANTTLDFEGRELGETSEEATAAASAMTAYGADFVADKRRDPGEDLISTLATAEIEDGDGGRRAMTDLELLMFFNLLVIAGSETTRNSIALGMVALIENPDQLEALRGDRSLMPTAVEEILRWTSATTYNRRTATRDTSIAGCSIERGAKVTLWWPSANRDEEIFDRADRFDIRRTPNPHLSFGHRSHICLGATLARMEIRLIFGELLDRLDDFELTGPVERVRTNKHAGVWRVPMSYRPRRRA